MRLSPTKVIIQQLVTNMKAEISDEPSQEFISATH